MYSFHSMNQDNNPVEWLFKETTGESPALGTVTRAAKATGNIITGDVGRGAKGWAKSLPVVGPLNFVGEKAKEIGDEWNFK